MEGKFYIQKAESDCLLTLFFRADADGIFDCTDENFAVADLTGFGSLNNRIDRGRNLRISENNFDLNLGEEIDSVLTAAINLRVALLPPESFDLADGHSLNPNFRQCFLNIFQFERLDNRLDFLHRLSL